MAKLTNMSVCAWPSSMSIMKTIASPSSSLYDVGLKPTVTAVQLNEVIMKPLMMCHYKLMRVYTIIILNGGSSYCLLSKCNSRASRLELKEGFKILYSFIHIVIDNRHFYYLLSVSSSKCHWELYSGYKVL